MVRFCLSVSRTLEFGTEFCQLVSLILLEIYKSVFFSLWKTEDLLIKPRLIGDIYSLWITEELYIKSFFLYNC